MYWKPSIAAAHHSMNKGSSEARLCYVVFLEVHNTNDECDWTKAAEATLPAGAKGHCSTGCPMFEYHWSTVVFVFISADNVRLFHIHLNYWYLYRCLDAVRCVVHICTSIVCICFCVQNCTNRLPKTLFATNHQFCDIFFPFSLLLVFYRKRVTMGTPPGVLQA